MNKTLCRVISALLSIIVLQIVCSATSYEGTTFYYENGKEITVFDNHLSYDEKKMIADYFAYGTIESEKSSIECNTRSSILCTLFGHDLTTTYVREITHNAYPDSPKCLRSEYECTYCTRSSCDYIENKLIYSVRISTCHG